MGSEGSAALRTGSIQKLFQYQSARVIGLGRAMLSAVFLLAIWLDHSERPGAATNTFSFLFVYLAFSVTVAIATWNNWWVDARLAVPAHLIDMAAFAFICFAVSGYTSPFFLVFILPLMSAAIRWGWRETALTAIVLIVIFLAGGMLVAGSEAFELQRFIVRAGHLSILSAILIWFGIHQRFAAVLLSVDAQDDTDHSVAGDDDPLNHALTAMMDASGAARGTLLLRSGPNGRYAGLRREGGASDVVDDCGPLVRDRQFGSSFLFDTSTDRALAKSAHSAARFGRCSTVFDQAGAAELELGEGLAACVASSSAQGWLVLEGIADLSGDYIELGREFGRAAGAILDRSKLLSAIAQGAAARTRLSLARDVHDSIVQFIAGATFRVEAIARAARSGADVQEELKVLKGLLVEEQADIRGFVTALRSDRDLALADAVEELRELGARLGKHWAIQCTVDGQSDCRSDGRVDRRIDRTGEGVSIPIRLQLDLQHLMREAVANAVRHGGADEVAVSLTVDGATLRFDVVDNGTGFLAANGSSPVQPWSLRERVERAGGSLFLDSEPGRTNVSISLPLGDGGAAA